MIYIIPILLALSVVLLCVFVPKEQEMPLIGMDERNRGNLRIILGDAVDDYDFKLLQEEVKKQKRI